MTSFLRSLKTKSFALLLLACLLTLAACLDSNSNATNGSNGSNNANASITFKVGGKQDTESQLLTKMYVLLLRHAGFNAVEYTPSSTNDVAFKAINSGQIDLYPEFTATGLAKLELNSTGNALQDYLQVKQGYEAKYHITWLNPSPLNHTYGICTTQREATRLGVKNISDLERNVSSLTIATPSDAVHAGVGVVKAFYHLTFNKVVTYSNEAQAFSAVNTGTQNLNVCTVTSADIIKYKFVVLQDDKSAFPIYNPAPIIRDSVLKEAPQIAVTLNKLTPLLTTQVSQQLQSGVVNDGKSVTEVAQQFLQSKGLL